MNVIDITKFTKEKNIYKKGVYLITHKSTNIKYVGSTKMTFSKRWRSHLNGFLKNKGNTVLLNVFKKYGIEGFEFSILEEIEDISKIPFRELYWILRCNTFRSKYGANLSLDTSQPLLNRPSRKLSEKEKRKMRKESKTKKKTYLYDFEGNLLKVFSSSCSCDRYLGLKKGSTSQTIHEIGGRRTLLKKYIPRHEFIKKENFIFVYGQNEESRRKAGLKHKGKIINSEQRMKIRCSNPKSLLCILYEKDTNKKIKSFFSLNECDDFLGLTRGSTSKHNKCKCKFLKNKYYIKII